MRILVTGAAGAIGRVVVAGLVGRGHAVVALDHAHVPRTAGVEPLVGDVVDPGSIRSAVTRVDAVVHLAAIPRETTLSMALETHVRTTAAVLDAMVVAGVSRLVYTSSNHAVGSTPRLPLLTTEVRPRPDTYYGVGKIAAEALCSMYADHHGIDTVACRIGSFLVRPVTPRHLSTWLSHDDAVRMVDAACSAEVDGFTALYGISANTRAWWDLAPGHALGYHPEDDAETYADEILAGVSTDEGTDEGTDENTFVGGPWAITLPGPT